VLWGFVLGVFCVWFSGLAVFLGFFYVWFGIVLILDSFWMAPCEGGGVPGGLFTATWRGWWFVFSLGVPGSWGLFFLRRSTLRLFSEGGLSCVLIALINVKLR